MRQLLTAIICATIATTSIAAGAAPAQAKAKALQVTLKDIGGCFAWSPSSRIMMCALTKNVVAGTVVDLVEVRMRAGFDDQGITRWADADAEVKPKEMARKLAKLNKKLAAGDWVKPKMLTYEFPATVKGAKLSLENNTHLVVEPTAKDSAVTKQRVHLIPDDLKDNTSHELSVTAYDVGPWGLVVLADATLDGDVSSATRARAIAGALVDTPASKGGCKGAAGCPKGYARLKTVLDGFCSKKMDAPKVVKHLEHLLWQRTIDVHGIRVSFNLLGAMHGHSFKNKKLQGFYYDAKGGPAKWLPKSCKALVKKYKSAGKVPRSYGKVRDAVKQLHRDIAK